MEVDYRWWGREAYFLDGELIESKWSFSLAGLREFKIGNSKVRIEVEKWKKPPYSYLSPIIILSTCVLFALWLGGNW